MLTERIIKQAVESQARDFVRVVRHGEITVLAFEDRLFLYNQSSQHAFEVLPDFESGVMIQRLLP